MTLQTTSSPSQRLTMHEDWRKDETTLLCRCPWSMHLSSRFFVIRDWSMTELRIPVTFPSKIEHFLWLRYFQTILMNRHHDNTMQAIVCCPSATTPAARAKMKISMTLHDDAWPTTLRFTNPTVLTQGQHWVCLCLSVTMMHGDVQLAVSRYQNSMQGLSYTRTKEATPDARSKRIYPWTPRLD